MISMKQNLIIYYFLLCYVLSISNALQCKLCGKTDRSCLFAENVGTRKCEKDDDLCYSWFHRAGSEVAVQRDCMSIATPEYTLIKEVIGDKDRGCVKRTHGLDCFTFCSTDLCN